MAVRRESVRIEVDSNLAAVAARDAAAMKLLANTVDSVSKAGVQSDRSNKRISDSLSEVDQGAKRADLSINQLTGRLRVAADVAAILGPAIAPVGALAIPALIGLTTQLTFGAAAAGTALLAFNGMGDAIGAMNDYALEPSTANAEKLEASLAKLSPEAVRFARELGTMRGQFAATRDAAAEGLFPELTPALDDLDGLLQRVQPVIEEIGAVTGSVLADGLGSLNSDRWQDFFNYLRSDARPILSDLGATVGGFAHGISEVITAFGPLNRDFSGWLRGLGEGFSNWAEGLDDTQGFQDFIDYVRDNGPQVAATAGALGRALVEITTAAAPLGGPALAGVEAFANAISAIADSDIGTPIFTALAGMALFNRAMALGRASATAFTATRANFAALGGSIDQVGASAARSSAGIGRLGRGAVGITAVGAAVGVLVAAVSELSDIDIDAENLGRNLEAIAGGSGADSAEKLLDQVNESLTFMEGWQNQAVYKVLDPLSIGFDTPMEKYEANVRSMDQALAQLVEGGNADKAQQVFQRIAAMALDLPEGSSVAPWAAEGVMENFGAYQTALDNASAANGGYAGSADGAGDAAGRAALNVNQLAQEMRTQASEALAAFDAQTAWGQAVADAREQAASGAKGIDEMTEAGRGNRTALSGLASAWTGQSRAVKNNVGEYRQARNTFLEVADAMGIGAAQARRMADRMLEMPRKILISVEFRGMRKGIQDSLELGGQLGLLNGFIASPRVVAKTAQAGAALGGVIGLLGVVDKRVATPTVNANTAAAAARLGGIIGLIGNINDKTVTVTVLQNVQRGVSVGGGLGAPKAYGGPIVGPGTDRSDNILTPTSPGEWVHQAPAVRHYGHSAMDAINKMLIPREALRTTVSSTISPALTTPQRNNADFAVAMNQRHQDSIRQAGASGTSYDRQALERQGVQAAMRSGGYGPARNSHVGPLTVTGTLHTPWGPAEIEGIAERVALDVAEERIEVHREADESYARSMGGRVPV